MKSIPLLGAGLDSAKGVATANGTEESAKSCSKQLVLTLALNQFKAREKGVKLCLKSHPSLR